MEQKKKKLTCSIVILTYNDFETTDHLLRMIKEYKAFEHIVVVDNHSTDGSFDKLQTYSNSKITIMQAPGNDGYSKGNNIGIRYLLENYGSDIICVANPDIEFDEGLVHQILKVFEKKAEYCILAGLQVAPDGELAVHPFWMEYSTRQWFRFIIRRLRIFGRILKIYDTEHYIRKKLNSEKMLFQVGAVEGSMFFIRSKEFNDTGLFDEGVWIYCEEDILAKKMKKIRMKTGVLTSATFIHYGAKTTNKVFATKTKADHMFYSSIYYFNNYQSENKFFQAVNYILCSLVHLEDIVSAMIKNYFGKR